jgi:hypothetical protein
LQYVSDLRTTRKDSRNVIKTHTSYCHDLNELVDYQLKAIALKINEKKQLEHQ